MPYELDEVIPSEARFCYNTKDNAQALPAKLSGRSLNTQFGASFDVPDLSRPVGRQQPERLSDLLRPNELLLPQLTAACPQVGDMKASENTDLGPARFLWQQSEFCQSRTGVEMVRSRLLGDLGVGHALLHDKHVF